MTWQDALNVFFAAIGAGAAVLLMFAAAIWPWWSEAVWLWKFRSKKNNKPNADGRNQL